METKADVRIIKTPIYTRRAKKAYYERQKLNNPEFLSTLNEKNKARQRILKEIKALMSINMWKIFFAFFVYFFRYFGIYPTKRLYRLLISRLKE